MHEFSASPAAPSTTGRLQQLWLCEAIRLHEQHHPPLEDSAACRLARQQGDTLAERLLLRNLQLAEQEGLTRGLQQWLTATRWLALLLVAMALLTGSGLAFTAFNRAADSINIVWALLGLLGVHLITLVFWLGGLLYRPGQPSQFMQLPLSLLERLSHSPNAARLTAALLSLLARQRLTAAALSRLVHGWWLLVLLTALLTSLLLLGTHRYAFGWETTIASADNFILLVQGLGWPLHWLGFPVPDAELIRISGEQALSDATARQHWAGWLLGMLTVYGLLPRLLLALFFQWRWQRGRKRLQLDSEHSDWSWLHARLQPQLSSQVVDPQPEQLPQPASATASMFSGAQSATCLVALELEAPLVWPSTPPAELQQLGNLDGYAAQQQLLEQLAGRPCLQLILACDARRSPDRGSLYFISELARSCPQLTVWLLYPDSDHERLTGWQGALQQLDIPCSTTAPWLTDNSTSTAETPP